MSKLQIIQLLPKDFFSKSTNLRVKSEPVSEFGETFQKEVDDLIETLKSWEISVGLSAPQVGIQKRFAVVNISKNKEESTLVIVNPILKNISGKKTMKKESCLSLPQVRGEVERRYKISLSFQDRYGNNQLINAESFLARVILHEIDHLDGILFVDRMVKDAQLESLEIEWK